MERKFEHPTRQRIFEALLKMLDKDDVITNEGEAFSFVYELDLEGVTPVADKVKMLRHIQNLWIAMFGYEKDIFHNIEYKIQAIEEENKEC
jgi:hypothetical protein